jgi:hypothetical protein
LIAKIKFFRWMLLKKLNLCQLDTNNQLVCGNFLISQKYLIFQQALRKFK